MGPLQRVKLVEVHSQLVCELCSGYFVDATTIIECLHTFCKSCIVRYLETSNYCPTCEALVHKTKPLLNIREDKTVQDIVYKLVPGLFHKEINRRHSFYVEHPEACGDRTEQKLKEPRHFFYVDDQISLSLEYLPPAYAKAKKNGTPYAHMPSITNTSAKNPNGVVEGEGWSAPQPDSKSSPGADKEDQLEDKMSMKTVHKRYLKCPAAVQVSHLEKFVRLKYGLSPKHRVDIVHGGDHLDGDLTLLDVVYMYKWAEEAPLRLFYTVTIPRTTRKRHRINGTRAPNSEKGSSPPRKMPRGEGGKMGGIEGGVPKSPVNKEGIEEAQTQPQGAAASVNGNSNVDEKAEGDGEGGLGREEGKMVIDEDEKMEVDNSQVKSNQGPCPSTDTSQLPVASCTNENSSGSGVGMDCALVPSVPPEKTSNISVGKSNEAEPTEAQQPQQKVQKQNPKQQPSQKKPAQVQHMEQKELQEVQRSENQKPVQQAPSQVIKQQQQQQQQQQQAFNQQKQQQAVKQQDSGRPQNQEAREQQQVVRQQLVKPEVVKQQQQARQQQQIVKPQVKQVKLQQQVGKQQQQQQQQIGKQQQQHVGKQQQHQQHVGKQQQQQVQHVGKQQQQQPQQQVVEQQQAVKQQQLQNQQKPTLKPQGQDAASPAVPKKPVQSGANTTNAAKPVSRSPSTGKVVTGSKSFPQPQNKPAPPPSPTPPAPQPQQQHQPQHGVQKQLPNGTVSGCTVVVSKLEESKASSATPPPGVGGKPVTDKVPPPVIPTRPRLGRPPNASRKLNAAMSITAPGTAGSPRFVAPAPSQVSKSAVQSPMVRPPVVHAGASSATSPQTGTKTPNSTMPFSPTKGGAPLRGTGAGRGAVSTSLNVQNRLSSISGSLGQLQNSKLVVKKVSNAAGNKEPAHRVGKPGVSSPAAPAGTGKASSSTSEMVSSASRLQPGSPGSGLVVPRPPPTPSSRPPSSPSLPPSSSPFTITTTTTSSPSPASPLSSSHRTPGQHGVEQRPHAGGAPSPASTASPATPHFQQHGPRLSSPAAGTTKLPPKSPGKGRNPANILSIAQSLANKQLQQRTVTSSTPMSMPPTVTPAAPPTPYPAAKEGGSKSNSVSPAPISNMVAGTGTVTAASNINAPVSNVAGSVPAAATNVPVSNVVNNVPVNVPVCLASQFASMANPNLTGMSTSPLSPTLAAYISAFGDPSLFHGPLQEAAVRNLISWGQAAAVRIRDMNLTNMGTGTPTNLLDQHNFNMQQRTDAAPMDLSPTTKTAPTPTPVVNGKNSSPSPKTTVASKGQVTTTKSSASFSRSHGAAGSGAGKSGSVGHKNNNNNNSINKNSPTISPPTPEVTITKLPNATLATSTPTTTTRTTNTNTNSTANSKNNSSSNNSGGNSSGNNYNSNNNNNNSRPVPGLVKMPAHTNTVSITKRPVSSNKYAVAKSPANPSIRQIPNPSLLRHHQSEPRNNNTVSAKSAGGHHPASNANGPNKMWVGAQQTRGGAMLKAAGNSPLKETGPLPETSSILQIEHLTQSFDTSKGVGNRKYFDAR